jgi:type II secretory pathway component PulF
MSYTSPRRERRKEKETVRSTREKKLKKALDTDHYRVLHISQTRGKKGQRDSEVYKRKKRIVEKKLLTWTTSLNYTPNR